MDATLRQILTELFEYSQQIDQLRTERAGLQRQVENLTRQILDIQSLPELAADA